ncbi:hypothetical protein [Streptomyces tubercidicus]
MGRELRLLGPDSVVDFGPIPCTDFTIDPSGTRITATAPDGTGIWSKGHDGKVSSGPGAPSRRRSAPGLVLSCTHR